MKNAVLQTEKLSEHRIAPCPTEGFRRKFLVFRRFSPHNPSDDPTSLYTREALAWKSLPTGKPIPLLTVPASPINVRRYIFYR